MTDATVVLGSARALLLHFDGPVTPLVPATMPATACPSRRAGHQSDPVGEDDGLDAVA